jgi:hypothetical protein
MTIARYFAGLGILLVLALAAGLTGYAVRRRLLPRWHSASARLAEIVVALAVIVVVSELLGLAHAFNRTGLLSAGFALIVGASLWIRRLPPAAEPEPVARRALGPWGALVAAGSVVLVGVQWIIQAVPAIQNGMFEVDTLDYHLPVALHWAQTGVIGPVHQTVPGLPVGYYPDNGEIFHAIGMVAWQSDVLSLVLNLGWLALALLAAWTIGRRFNAVPLTMAAAGLVLSGPLLARAQPGSAMTDIPSIALLLCAVALLDVRSAGSRFGSLFVAGLAAGLAIGTKLTVLPMLGLATLGIVLLRRDQRGLTFGAWTGGLCLGGGFWYVRNLVVIGNPMPANRFPFGPLGLPVPQFRQFDTANQSILHYATNGHVLHRFAGDLRLMLGPVWAVIIVLALGGLAVGIANRRDRTVQLWGVTGLLGLVAYVATPTTAGGPEGNPVLFAVDTRYALPMMLVGLVLLAAWLSGRGRLTVAAELAASLMLLVTVAAKWRISGAPTQRRTITVAATLAVMAVLAVVWVIRHRSRVAAAFGRSVHTRPRRIAIASVAAAGVVLGPAGAAFAAHSSDHHYRSGYDAFPDAYGFFQNLPGDQRIATTGLAQAYPLTGPRLHGRITYIGEDVRGALDDYTSCTAWKAAVVRAHPDWLVTGPLLPGSTTEPAAARWARSDPAFRQVLSAQSVRVFKVVGTPSPATC